MPRFLQWGDRLPRPASLELGSAEAQKQGCTCDADLWRIDPRCWLHGEKATALLAGACLCKSCLREGMHDPECSVHLADNEALPQPPCDCGLREGVRKEPANRMIQPANPKGGTLPN